MGVAYYAMLMFYLFPKLMGHQEITKPGDRRLAPGLGGPLDPMQALRGLVFLSGMIFYDALWVSPSGQLFGLAEQHGCRWQALTAI